MATFRITYVSGTENQTRKITALDSVSAGKAFIRKYPHISSEMILDVTEIMDASLDTSGDFLTRLLSGRVGLAMTYWVYGVLGGLVWGVGIGSLDLEPGGGSIKFVSYLLYFYYLFIYIGIWNAASIYRGNKIWAILAKFIVVITAVPVVISFFK